MAVLLPLLFLCTSDFGANLTLQLGELNKLELERVLRSCRLFPPAAFGTTALVLLAVIQFSYLAWLAMFFVRHTGLSPGDAKGLVLFFLTIWLVGHAMAQFLVRWLPLVVVWASGGIATLAGQFLLLEARNMAAGAIALALIGCGLSFVLPVGAKLAARRLGEHLVLWAWVSIFIAMPVSLGGCWLLGWLTKAFGTLLLVEANLFLGGALFLILGLLWLETVLVAPKPEEMSTDELHVEL